MPILTSDYEPPLLLKGGHIQTIFPNLFKKVKGISYHRERVITPDQDFFDIDWSKKNSEKLVVVLHGLEGSAAGYYVQSVIKHFNQIGWDGLGMNFRSCSGEPNLQRRFYHSGETGDLSFLLDKLVNEKNYEEIYLIGFSLGGNVCLKYLGEEGLKAKRIIKKAAAISVPCDLTSSAAQLSRRQNKIYMMRFMRRLRKKIFEARKIHPDLPEAKHMKTFLEFDGTFTAPLHGFKSAEDYWRRASSRPGISNIQLPTLLINAWNDPFLAPACFPIEEAEKSKFFHLLAPAEGGHVGFLLFNKQGLYWHEKKIIDFFTNNHSS